MNNNFKLDIAYIAGLFDGEGSIYYKQIIEKRKGRNPCKVWKIRMEMSMTDKNVMELVHETFERGILREKKIMGKKQWRWRCLNKDCFFIARLLWPHVMIKLHKIEQIIDHYEPDIQDLNDNVVELDKFRDNIWFKK